MCERVHEKSLVLSLELITKLKKKKKEKGKERKVMNG